MFPYGRLLWMPKPTTKTRELGIWETLSSKHADAGFAAVERTGGWKRCLGLILISWISNNVPTHQYHPTHHHQPPSPSPSVPRHLPLQPQVWLSSYSPE